MENTKKITLMIHPFYYIKEDMNRCYPDVNALSFDESEVFENLGNFNDNEKVMDMAKRRLEVFKEGIDFAKDGVLVFLRAEPDQGYTQVEKLLFDYALKTIPKEDLYFDSPISEKKHGSNKKVLEFLVNRLGSTDSLRKIQLYSFGEDLDACVPQTTCRIHKFGKFSNPAIILAKYSTPHTESLDKAIGVVSSYFYPEISFNKKSYPPEFNPERLKVHWDK